VLAGVCVCFREREREREIRKKGVVDELPQGPNTKRDLLQKSPRKRELCAKETYEKMTVRNGVVDEWP